MPRGIRKKARQYVLDRFQDEDPESYFKYKMHSGLSQDQMELVQAITNQSVSIVKTLLNNGLDPNFTVMPGRLTPLHLAVKYFDFQNHASENIFRSLLFFGAETDVRDEQGNTPLHTACICKSQESVSLLIQAGSNLDFLNNIQETPLMTTCRHARLPSHPIVNLLIQAGAIPILKNSMGQTALHILSESVIVRTSLDLSRHKIAFSLMEAGLRPDEPDHSGKTPLYYELQHMTKCSSNTMLMIDILKRESSLWAVVGTGISLVQGGAMHSNPHSKQIEALIFAIGAHSHSLSIVQDFLGAISSYVPPAIFKKCNKMMNRMNHVRQFENIQYRVGPLHPVVPSLALLAKISIRTSLKGNVIPNVKELAVPAKVKQYLLSNDVVHNEGEYCDIPDVSSARENEEES